LLYSATIKWNFWTKIFTILDLTGSCENCNFRPTCDSGATLWPLSLRKSHLGCPKSWYRIVS
jgi:hypothetical protein